MALSAERPARLPAALRADCSRCAALCCVVPPFEAVQGFGFDKPAQTACRHLAAGTHCAIHDQRVQHRFSACIGFDCYGAGQRVLRELGLEPGRLAAANSAEVASAYASLLVLHRLMAALTIAAATLPSTSRAPLRRRRMALNSLCRTEAAKKGSLNLAQLERETFAAIRAVVDPARLTA